MLRSTPDLGRFRINLHRERGRAAAAIRRLPTIVPRLATLGLPPSVEALTKIPRGLVLLGGPTGSGKTTTLAALVNEINLREPRHIITIEDPIEYEHQHRRGVVEHVEIGIDAPDFPTALRAALRQAPDIIVVGEMRDPETMQMALAAGETGHLVFSSLHTTDAASTVARIADSFPLERQNTVRQELSMALAAILVQTLLPRVGGGVVPAAELLMVGYGARQHVRKNAAPPPSGNHHHDEERVVHARGVAGVSSGKGWSIGKGVCGPKHTWEELERLRMTLRSSTAVSGWNVALNARRPSQNLALYTEPHMTPDRPRPPKSPTPR
jgi:pilus retraction protein PilT